jgi:hypothetical protein
LRVGAVLREQNALPTQAVFTKILTAKDAVDNGVAGRAAKGENPSLCAIKRDDYFVLFPFSSKPLYFFPIL